MIECLAARGLTVSVAQLERWRTAGLLPAHARRWLGRGRGSVSALDDATVAIAAALARHARQGRDLRWTVLGWYAEAGRPVLPGAAPVPEPPWSRVREALLWALSSSSAQRLLEQARKAKSDEAQDAFYVAAERVLGRRPAGAPHPSEVRRVLQARDTAASVRAAGGARWPGAVRLVAAVGMGADEVGGDLLAEALAEVLGTDRAQVTDAVRQAEANGALTGWSAPRDDFPLARLARASEREMARAREVAHQLAGFGALYLAHGLLMPDTPALAALRAQIDELGLGAHLMHFTALMLNASGVPHVLSACLAPEIAALADLLQSVLHDHAEHGLLHRLGSPEDGEAFMREWLAALHTAAAIPPTLPHDDAGRLGEDGNGHGNAPQSGSARRQN